MESRIQNRYYRETKKNRLNQCDIVQNIKIASASDFDLLTGKYSISEYNLPYGIVINQECDLENDFENRFDPQALDQDKLLPNILILPAYLSEEFRSGSHLGQKLIGHSWESEAFKQIRDNLNLRFHHIQKNENFQIPDLVIDFKHLYSLKTEIAYKLIDKIYYISISELFREQISSRFTYYLGRIGLPDIN